MTRDSATLFDPYPTAGGEKSARLSPCGLYRYELKRRWSAGPTATWIMLNPSTADAEQDDPTIRRCIGFTKAWGLGGLTVVNLFALRSTDPKALTFARDPVGPGNDEAIHDAAVGARVVVCAWGAHATAKDRAAQVLDLLDATLHTPMCLDRTKDGQPRHPLYMSKEVDGQPRKPIPLEADHG
jgi:hypothetical protein